MRHAYHDVGFMLDDAGAVQGLNLGYDRCSDHEWGIDGIRNALGVNLPKFPRGIEDRMATLVPTALRWQEFMSKPCDKRRKGFPTAMLSLLHENSFENDTAVQERDNEAAAQFAAQHESKVDLDYETIVTQWDSDGFRVQVRGVKNIDRLRRIHEAFLAKDIALGLPWSRSFFRGGVSLVIASSVPDEEKVQVLAQDDAYKALELAAIATGVADLLKSAGRGYYALSANWFDGAKDEVVFFLNPMEQRKYNFGWFTVQELTEWTNGVGPVVMDDRLNAFAKLPDQCDWGTRLLEGMNRAGIQLRHHGKFVWLDEAKTIPGLRVRVTRDSEKLFPSGDYNFVELMAKYALPLIVGTPVVALTDSQ